MTTGALIYLVSACGSGGEFIAAFRRYADRNGLFVPIADPIPAGRRGRFAVALRDGGVMVEGEAEVVSSARTPSVLHGRVGMTLRFVGSDEPSKIVLDELVKARLAMKPPPSSVAPRPAELPPAPRPVPPAPGGRIDAASALAECVAIGDVGALQAVEGAIPPKAGPKFVVPSIPPVGKATPTPPAALPRVAKLEDLPPPLEAFEGPKTEAMSAIDLEPAPPTATPTSISVPAPTPTPTPISIPVPAPLPPPTVPAAAKPAKRPSGQLPGMPPAPASPPRRPSAPLFAPPPPSLVERPSSFDIAPLPPPPTGPMPVPDVPVPGAPPREALADGEPTDVAAPIPAVAAAPRPPVIGVPPPPRPPVIEEPTPSGDWTMVPGADGPTIQPRVPKPRPQSQPTGNWSIALDPQSEGGWSPPVKIDPTPLPAGRAKSEPMPVVSSTQPLESEPRRPVADLAAISEPKVQVDPTLIEPLIPLPEAGPSPVRSSGSQPSMEAPMAASSSSGMRFQHLLTPVPGFAPPYAPPAAPAQAGLFPPHANGAILGPQPHYPSDAVAPVPPSRRTQIIIIVASAFLVLGAAVAVFLVISGDRGHSDEAAPPATPQPPSAPQPATGATAPEPAADRAADRAAVPPAPVDTAPAAGSAAAGATAAAPCSFEVASTPPGAEIVGESGEVIATTPGKLSLPCDIEVKLAFRKARYLPLERKYTPTSDAKPLKVALAKLTFSLKVSSTPPGATVTIGGKPQGVTPTTVRVPANELSTLTLTKEGFATEVQKITPKQNNQAVQVTLKRTSPPPRKTPR